MAVVHSANLILDHAQRPLRFFFGYSRGEISEPPADNQWDFLQRLKSWGFPINPETRRCDTPEDTTAPHEYWRETGVAGLRYRWRYPRALYALTVATGRLPSRTVGLLLTNFRRKAPMILKKRYSSLRIKPKSQWRRLDYCRW